MSHGTWHRMHDGSPTLTTGLDKSGQLGVGWGQLGVSGSHLGVTWEF